MERERGREKQGGSVLFPHWRTNTSSSPDPSFWAYSSLVKWLEVWLCPLWSLGWLCFPLKTNCNNASFLAPNHLGPHVFPLPPLHSPAVVWTPVTSHKSPFPCSHLPLIVFTVAAIFLKTQICPCHSPALKCSSHLSFSHWTLSQALTTGISGDHLEPCFLTQFLQVQNAQSSCPTCGFAPAPAAHSSGILFLLTAWLLSLNSHPLGGPPDVSVLSSPTQVYSQHIFTIVCKLKQL